MSSNVSVATVVVTQIGGCNSCRECRKWSNSSIRAGGAGHRNRCCCSRGGKLYAVVASHCGTGLIAAVSAAYSVW